MQVLLNAMYRKITHQFCPLKDFKYWLLRKTLLQQMSKNRTQFIIHNKKKSLQKKNIKNFVRFHTCVRAPTSLANGATFAHRFAHIVLHKI